MSIQWLWLLFFAVIAGFLGLFAPILNTFVFAFVLAYMGSALVHQLEHKGIRRVWAVLIVYMGFLVVVIGALVLLIPLLAEQIASLYEQLPKGLQWFHGTVTPWVQEKIGINQSNFDTANIETLIKGHLDKAGSFVSDILGTVFLSSMMVIDSSVNFIFTLVVAFYVLRDWDTMIAGIKSLLPRKYALSIIAMGQESNHRLGAFFKGQLLVMLGEAIVYSVGLTLIGLDLGILIGILCGICGLVPYMAMIVGFSTTIIATIMQYGGLDMHHLSMIVLVFAIGQSIEGMVLTPWLVGDRIGVHPAAVMFALLAGGQLFGFVGVLLSLPAAAVIMVLLRHLTKSYQKSELYYDDRPG